MSTGLSGLPRVRENSGKLNFFQGQGIVRDFCEPSGKFENTVKPHYFESQSYEGPRFFKLYPKSRQELHCIAPKIVGLFLVSKIRKCEHKGLSRASDNFPNLIV